MHTHRIHSATDQHLQISSCPQDTQTCPLTHTHARPTHTQCMTPHSCYTLPSGSLSRQPISRSQKCSHTSLHMAPHKHHVSTPHLSHQPSPRTPTPARLCSASPTRPAPARGLQLGVQRPQWPGIKMQRGGAEARQHRVSRSPALAAAAPPAPSRRPSELRSRCSKLSPRQRRAAAAQVRPGPEEGRATGKGAQPAPRARSL